MASDKTQDPKTEPQGGEKDRRHPNYCSMPPPQEREFAPNVTGDRERLIRRFDKKWANGTPLHYHFLEEPAPVRPSTGERDVVREAFQTWKEIGIGLEFQEVSSPDEAEIRIGALKGDGSWSYLGRDVLNRPQHERTMNFGWDITRPGEIDTAVHEIGHTLGFPHEHQNPFAGIEWDEEAVYQALAQPPNNWDRATTFHNIIRKIDADEVQGSSWDPDSVMHYPFSPGLIRSPEEYARNGISPAPGLSDRDKEWIRQFYPPTQDQDERLTPFQAVQLHLDPGEQRDFLIEPEATRDYQLATFGVSDSVLVLFEDVDGSWRFHSADDDSGWDYNAHLEARLYQGRRYRAALRLYYQHRQGDLALMLW